MGSGGQEAGKGGCRLGIRDSMCLRASIPHTQER